jgi:hypothetical protein
MIRAFSQKLLRLLLARVMLGTLLEWLWTRNSLKYQSREGGELYDVQKLDVECPRS